MYFLEKKPCVGDIQFSISSSQFILTLVYRYWAKFPSDKMPFCEWCFCYLPQDQDRQALLP